MMGKFRISLGSASCDGYLGRNAIEKGACEHLFAELDALKKLSWSEVCNLPAQKTRTVNVGGKSIDLTTIKKDLNNDEVLLVVRAFLLTFWFPTFFSSDGIGKIFVEGIVASAEKTRKAYVEELWAYK